MDWGSVLKGQRTQGERISKNGGDKSVRYVESTDNNKNLKEKSQREPIEIVEHEVAR